METYVDGSEVAVCLTSVDTFWPAFYFIATILLFFVVPFLILLILYSIIAKHLMNNSGLITHGHRSHTVLKYRKQVIFMLGTVVLSFFLCLLPFRALTFWIIIVPPETIMSLGVERYYNILYFCRIMMYLNSAMNPILYNLMSTKFRDGFLKLLGCGYLCLHKKRHSGGDRQGTFHTTSTNMSSSSSSRRDQHWHQYNNNSSMRFTRTDSMSSGGGGKVTGGIEDLDKSNKITNKIDSARRSSVSSSDDDDIQDTLRYRNGISGSCSNTTMMTTNSGCPSSANVVRRNCKTNFDDIKEESDDDEPPFEPISPSATNQFRVVDCELQHRRNDGHDNRDDDDDYCEYGIVSSGMEVMACIIPHYGRLMTDHHHQTVHIPRVINKIDSVDRPAPLGIVIDGGGDATTSTTENQLQLLSSSVLDITPPT